MSEYIILNLAMAWWPCEHGVSISAASGLEFSTSNVLELRFFTSVIL